MDLSYRITSAPLHSAALAFVLTLATGLFATAPAHADGGLVLGIANSTAIPGSATNSFDVSITNTTSGGVDIGGFSFELTTTSTDVTFTDVTTASPAYIFAANSLFGPDILINAAGNTVLAEDNYGTSNSGITLASGQTLDLGHVVFTLDSSAPASSIPLAFFAYPATSVNDFLGNDYTDTVFGLDNTNSFTIPVGATSVPEPASLLIGFQGLSMAYLAFARRLARKTVIA